MFIIYIDTCHSVNMQSCSDSYGEQQKLLNFDLRTTSEHLDMVNCKSTSGDVFYIIRHFPPKFKSNLLRNEDFGSVKADPVDKEIPPPPFILQETEADQ